MSQNSTIRFAGEKERQIYIQMLKEQLEEARSAPIVTANSCCDCAYVENQSEIIDEDESAADDLDDAVAAFYADEDFEGFDGFDNLDPGEAYHEASDFDEFDMSCSDSQEDLNSIFDRIGEELNCASSEDEDDEVAVTLSDLFCKWKEVQNDLALNIAALTVAVSNVEELLDDLFNALI